MLPNCTPQTSTVALYKRSVDWRTASRWRLVSVTQACCQIVMTAVRDKLQEVIERCGWANRSVGEEEDPLSWLPLVFQNYSPKKLSNIDHDYV